MPAPTGPDRFITRFDQILRTVSGSTGLGRAPSASVPTKPPPTAPIPTALAEADRLESGRLMRVNHCGEVCAQALYLGQAIASSNPRTVQVMSRAAEEEMDHLAWCEQRLKELDTPVSHLNPLFFLAGFSAGVASALLGDKFNLGFVAATEEQVVAHLDAHIKKLPADDHASRAILGRMRQDEDEHRVTALKGGGFDFPRPMKRLMTLLSRVMTRTTYWV